MTNESRALVESMTLRDYFAGQALASSDVQAVSDNSNSIEYYRDSADDIAARCYTIADAMLKARGE